jgi:hypothetical protein
MNLGEAQPLVSRASGLLLDTNILLLDIVGGLGEGLVERFKRTRDRFESSDLAVLRKATAAAKVLLTTPHVLTETSNFLGQLPNRYALQARRILLERLKVWTEDGVAAQQAALQPEVFCRLGITDWAISHLAKRGFLVLTDDLLLYNQISSSGSVALNFNHLRDVE